MTIIDFRSDHRMSRNRRQHKPSAPRVIEPPRGAKPGDWGVNDEALRLGANADVSLNEGRGVVGKRRVRQDVFALLYYRPGSKLSTQAYDAVRRLQEDIAILHRTQGASDAIRTAGPAQTGALAVVSEDFAKVRVLAGKRVAIVLDGGKLPNGQTHLGMKPWASKLIRALCEHDIAPDQAGHHWKALVRQHSNQHRPSQAGLSVCQAADALAESYRTIDNAPREKVA